MAVKPYDINRIINYWMTEQMNSGGAQPFQIRNAGKAYAADNLRFLNQHLDEVVANYVYSNLRYGQDSEEAQQYLTDVQGAVKQMRDSNVDNTAIQNIITSGTDLGKSYYTTWKGSVSDGGFGLGSIIGVIGDTFKDLGPLGVILGNLAVPGLGTALGVVTAIDEGADIGDIAKNVAIGEIVNQVGIGADVTDATGSSLAGELAQNTVKGLLSGQDLDTALTNAAVNTGVSTVAGELTNQTPEDFQADVEEVLDSPASTPVSDYLADINDVLDMPATTELVGPPGPEPVSGQDLSADLTGANTIEDITSALSGEGQFISGQDLAADAIPGNTIADIVDVLPPLDEPQLPPAPTEPGLTKAQVETLIKTALAATAADQVVNQPEPQKTGFDIVPVPTDWSSPVYDQSFTPVDLDSIFQNLQGMQTQWKPRPNITGGAYMGSPVNISDIVNNIMSAELTPTTMPSQITNAVGGILGPTATR